MKMRAFLAAGVSAIACVALLLNVQADPQQSSGEAMGTAAIAFRDALTEDQRAMCTFGIDDPERLNWHFIPRPRKGIPLKALEGEPLNKATALIKSGLSESGYDQAMNVMSLEEVLYLLEPGDRAYRRDRRDPGKYYISLFGDVSVKGTKWGWRIEGHHLSLNYTIENGVLVSTTPEFFGANPGLIEAGPGRSIRILAPEEDTARQILKLCTPEQKKKMFISEKAPNDIRAANIVQPELGDLVGLRQDEMSADQQNLLRELLGEYMKNMPERIGEQRKRGIDAAGWGSIQISWWGGEERNQPHYYRIQGPTFQVEYNNVQNEANHVHSVWRTTAGDFGIPLAAK